MLAIVSHARRRVRTCCCDEWGRHPTQPADRGLHCRSGGLKEGLLPVRLLAQLVSFKEGRAQPLSPQQHEAAAAALLRVVWERHGRPELAHEAAQGLVSMAGRRMPDKVMLPDSLARTQMSMVSWQVQIMSPSSNKASWRGWSKQRVTAPEQRQLMVCRRRS